ncbi:MULTISPECIES: ATP-dependent DNA ligase [Cryobacterium]|uniref:ATP-dependent DNA ligase n=1 Tax=Cryobacterium gelidum TaxID=1259164 RepID=A0A4R9AX18_9MICO|nr:MULTISPECIES: ATP-dependent DNA ligase [Cryobacterium]TFB67433.1 ATP-dependent DNA ligase [Cryobacterium sp. Hz9]TFD71362.1 ATP-dependent DNA ligase [Cryobacterium gelidum]
MGKLTYDSSITVDFDDRVLAHIQLVIGAKLRRGESFYFSWRDDPLVGGGRSTVWMHPGISLAYKYFGSKTPTLNRDWVEALSLSANSATGLQIVAEPPPRTP